jgi:hypothetical protein
MRNPIPDIIITTIAFMIMYFIINTWQSIML